MSQPVYLVEYEYEAELCFSVEAVNQVIECIDPDDLSEATITEYRAVEEVAVEAWRKVHSVATG